MVTWVLRCRYWRTVWWFLSGERCDWPVGGSRFSISTLWDRLAGLELKYSGVREPKLDVPIIEVEADDGVAVDLYNESYPRRIRSTTWSVEGPENGKASCSIQAGLSMK